ncbi:MAG: hypothetical protein N2170_00560, partial [Bacteroidia bacterium]|nr:hypothetical protein [Bacteroidia bacterium]
MLRSHGLRGHVIVETFSEQPEAYDCSVFWVAFAHQSQAVPHRVVFREAHTSSARKNQGRSSKWRLRFQGCVDREAADALVRAELYLPRSFLPPLSPGQFYYVEAEGARVVD